MLHLAHNDVKLLAALLWAGRVNYAEIPWVLQCMCMYFRYICSSWEPLQVHPLISP